MEIVCPRWIKSQNGTTACKWDIVIPFDKLWNQYNRVLKDNGVVALFGTEPFSSYMRLSNISNFKYDWIWEKSKCANFMNAKYMPLKKHELISIFYSVTPTYSPQMKQITPYSRTRKAYQPTFTSSGLDNEVRQICDGNGYPTSIIYFKCVSNSGTNKERTENSLHPTQKPCDLLEYLIKTYTNENDTVLDSCMGSGSTGIACLNTNRNFIGIEKDENYFNIAKDRIENHLPDHKEDIQKDGVKRQKLF